MGARAYRHLSLYQPAPGCLIEIGSERGEGSTQWLADYATRHNLQFHTADIDPDTYAAAALITPGARLLRGVDLLKELDEPISIAYLDGFDWIPAGLEQEPWVADQRARYIQLGYTLNNTDCQAEHLAEAQLVAGKAVKRCVVICDDTWLDGDGWTGKGGLAVPYLQSQGFTVVDHDQPEHVSLGYVVLKR